MSLLKRTMGHLVLGYPNLTDSIETAIQYMDAGFRFIECQIPFSHPYIDGDVIRNANQKALEKIVSNAEIETAILTLKRVRPNAQFMMMTYLNRYLNLHKTGFTTHLSQQGIDRWIIPDLDVLQPIEAIANINIIPVISANIRPARLQQIIDMSPDYIYVSAAFGLTGKSFSVDDRLQHVISQIQNNDISALTGFGIRSRSQLEKVLSISRYAVIGSELLRQQESGQLSEYLQFFK